MARIVLASVAVAACSVPDLDLEGKQCPCAADYVCDATTNTCVRPRDGGPIDAGLSTCAIDVLGNKQNTCVIRTDHTMWCVGQNGRGQLGIGTTKTSLELVQVGTLTGVKQIALGAQNAYALDDAGAVWAWGSGDRGAIGTGGTADSASPIRVDALPTKTTQLAVGESHACALDGSGDLRCWGWNTNGQIGNGTETDQPTPMLVVSGVAAVVASGRRTCFIKRVDSTVSCWGKNTEGEVGIGNNSSPQPLPLEIPMFDALELAAGGHHTCARRADNTVWCWGRSTFGQMGNGSLAQQLSPAQVPGVADVVALNISGGRRTCARLANGDITCWGETPFGIRNQTPPMMIDPPTTVPQLAGVTVLTTASDHTCAIMPDNVLRCAGQNDSGQLGDGTTMPHFAFAPTTLPCP